jgi:hypothetical protein
LNKSEETETGCAVLCSWLFIGGFSINATYYVIFTCVLYAFTAHFAFLVTSSVMCGHLEIVTISSAV